MTNRSLYLLAKKRLREGGADPADALALTEFFLGLDRPGLALRGGESPDPQTEAAFLRAVEERAARRPLQYILGQWDFMGLTLQMGEGVLCPREDTAVLVEALAEALKAAGLSSPRGLDLCAGAGAVGLGLCSLLPKTEVCCVELSAQALFYLEKNISAYPEYAVKALRGDVLSRETAGVFPQAGFDFIASNPPYVRTGEIAALQPEVRKEPALALDGGQDGLMFYRAIAEIWLPLLKPGGILAVEIGEDQGPAVKSIFSAHGLTDIKTLRDWAGLDRVVTAKTPV